MSVSDGRAGLLFIAASFFHFFIVFVIVSLFSWIYRWWHRIDLMQSVANGIDSQRWSSGRVWLSAFVNVYSQIFHGYEVIGMENLPKPGKNGGALLICYHGAIPLDSFFLQCRYLAENHVPLRIVADNFMFKVPALRDACLLFGAFKGKYLQCIDALRKGQMVFLYPGGAREAIFSENYELMWKDRTGFAKLALDAKVPIIPVFTQNIREAYQSMNFLKSWYRSTYETIRLPLFPISGGLPVKLRTYIGKPIPYDPKSSPSELAQNIAYSMQNFISKHQRIPASTTQALMDRLRT